MLRAFSTAATGMTAQQMTVNVIANNLANMNTAGFKRTIIDFQDLVYLRLKEPGVETASGIEAPTGFELGSGVRPASTLKVFTQGELENTGRPLDLAIQGDGFFCIRLPSGEERYTRDGSFRVNADGQLVTAQGFVVEPGITIPSDARSVYVGVDGTVTVFKGSEQTGSQLGTIKMVRFRNPSGLMSEGGNLLAATPASGDPVQGTAGEEGFGSIQAGFLERSNVEMVTELVNLITAQRAYEINSRAIRAGDEMLETTNRLIT